MAASLAQVPTFTEGTNVTSLNRTFGSTPTAGNLITAHGAGWNGTAYRTITVSDNKSNTYSYFTNNLQTSGGGSDFMDMRGAYCANISTSATHTVTCTFSGSANASFDCIEWSGIETSPTTSFNSGTGTSTTPSSGAVSPGAASLIVGCCTYNGSSTTIAVNSGGGYSQAFEADENSDNQAQNCEYQVSLSGSQTPTWTLGASRLWTAYVGAFSEVSAGGAIPHNVFGKMLSGPFGGPI